MTDEQKKRLESLKKKKSKSQGLHLEIFSDEDLKALHKKFSAMQEMVGDALDGKYKTLTELQEAQFTEVNNKFVQLISAVEQASNNSEVASAVKQAISAIHIPPFPTKLEISNPTEIPSWLASDETLQETTKAVREVKKAIADLVKKPSQEPGEFVPYRRVVRVGNRLVFDDTATPASGGGGSNNSHNSWNSKILLNQKATIATISGIDGAFGGYMIANENDAFIYLQVFDTTGAVVLGSTTPSQVFGIPPTASANVEFTNGIRIANGIKIACATTASGSTPPGTGLDMTVLYE